MANRLTKGTAIAGGLAQDRPGFHAMGPIRITNPGTTSETTTNFSFSSQDVLENFYVKVTTVTATSGLLGLGLLSTYTSGFVIALPVGTTGLKTTVQVSTSGSAPLNFVSASYLGPLLGAAIAGTTEGSTGGTAVLGEILLKPYSLDSTTNTTLSFTYNSTAAFTALVYPIFYRLSS